MEDRDKLGRPAFVVERAGWPQHPGQVRCAVDLPAALYSTCLDGALKAPQEQGCLLMFFWAVKYPQFLEEDLPVKAPRAVNKQRKLEGQFADKSAQLVRRREVLGCMHASVMVELDPQSRKGVNMVAGATLIVSRRACRVT